MSDSSEQNKIDVGRKIMQWLEEESAIFQEEKDPYRMFKVVVFPANDMPIYITIDKQKIDSLTLVARSGFSEQDKKALSHSHDKRIDFVRRLRSALLQSRVTYNFYPDFNNIEYIEIYKTLYFDGLSKHRFFQYIEDIVRALSWLSLEYEKLNGSHETNFLTGFIL
jgi:hypothetical protein